MQDRCRLRLLLVLGGALTAFSVVALAAPFLETSSRLPDQVRSLARVESISLQIDLSPELEKRKITNRRLLPRWRRRLEDAGYEVRDGADAALLVLSVSAVTDPNIPDVVAFTPYLALEQKARVGGDDLRVPTYVDILVGMVHLEREDLEESVTGALNDMFNRFVQVQDQARRDARARSKRQ